MSSQSFRDGSLSYSLNRFDTKAISARISKQAWADGYIAFSRGEIRLGQWQGRSLASLPEGRVSDLPNCEGYLMELGLWHREGSVLCEVFAERTPQHWLLHSWQLEMAPTDNPNCIWRPAATTARQYSILCGSDLSSIEAVWPEKRLHFFLMGQADV